MSSIEELVVAAKELVANEGELVWEYARRYGCAIPCGFVERLRAAIADLEKAGSIDRFEAVNRFHVAGWNLTHFGHYCPAGSQYLPAMLEAAKR